MQNIEIKSPLQDRARVEAMLKQLGARQEWVRRQRDTFFSVPRGWLKLREMDGATELIAYERATDHAGPRASDYDIGPVQDPALWLRLLGRVLPVDRVVEKVRTLWLYKHTRVHLDEVSGLGDFLELETVVAGISRREAEAETELLVRALELDREKFISVPYRDLLS